MKSVMFVYWLNGEHATRINITSIVNNEKDFLVVWDSEGRKVRVNKKQVKMFTTQDVEDSNCGDTE